MNVKRQINGCFSTLLAGATTIFRWLTDFVRNVTYVYSILPITLKSSSWNAVRPELAEERWARCLPDIDSYEVRQLEYIVSTREHAHVGDKQILKKKMGEFKRGKGKRIAGELAQSQGIWTVFIFYQKSYLTSVVYYLQDSRGSLAQKILPLFFSVSSSS